MQFDTYTPSVEDIGEEALNYADRVTIDSGGVDLHFFGSNVSASFQDVDVFELAYGILKDDFTPLSEDVIDLSEEIASYDLISDDHLERQAITYLRALVLRSGGQL